jgi:hypothetical protein
VIFVVKNGVQSQPIFYPFPISVFHSPIPARIQFIHPPNQTYADIKPNNLHPTRFLKIFFAGIQTFQIRPKDPPHQNAFSELPIEKA